MYYTYVLYSKKDDNIYTGFTQDLNLRFDQHNKCWVESTKDMRPFELIYYEIRKQTLDRLNPRTL